MALAFTSADYLRSIGLAPAATLSAFTFGCRLKINPDGLGIDQTIAIRGEAFSSSAADLLFWRDEQGSAYGRQKTLAVLIKTDAGLLRAEAESDTLSDSEWRHVAVVFESGRPDGLRLYVDGQRDPNVVSTADVASTVPTDDELSMARSFGSKVFSGSLADVVFYSAALPDAEIALLSRGATPLALSNRFADLQLYQDLIRQPNSSGVGARVASIGAPTVSRHPPLFGMSGSRGAAISRRFVAASRLFVEHSEAAAAGAAAGSLSLSGIDSAPSNGAAEVLP